MSAGSLSSCTDDELVTMIRAGGATREAAWSDMLRRYTPKMYGVACSFDIDQATAEDLVQTAWLRFLERSDQLRDTSSVGPWLCMIVRNEARRLVTRRRTVPVADGWETRPADTAATGGGNDRRRAGSRIAQRLCPVGRRLPAAADPDAGRPAAVVRRDRRCTRSSSRVTRTQPSTMSRTSAPTSSDRTRDRGMTVTKFHVSANARRDHAGRSTPTTGEGL